MEAHYQVDDLDRLTAEALEENRIAMSALAQRIDSYFKHIEDVHDPLAQSIE